MIEVCPYHIGSLLNLVFSQDSIEHYREEEEFESLDFSCEPDARYAIRRWIGNGLNYLPEKSEDSFGIGYHDGLWDSKQNKKLFKEDLRYILTKNILVSSAELPGIDFNIKDTVDNYDEWSVQQIKNWEDRHHSFLMLLWDEWFDEPFEPANLELYRERVDSGFVSYPFAPNSWGSPEYKEN